MPCIKCLIPLFVSIDDNMCLDIVVACLSITNATFYDTSHNNEALLAHLSTCRLELPRTCLASGSSDLTTPTLSKHYSGLTCISRVTYVQSSHIPHAMQLQYQMSLKGRATCLHQRARLTSPKAASMSAQGRRDPGTRHAPTNPPHWRL
jgi:hypothetical protein